MEIHVLSAFSSPLLIAYVSFLSPRLLHRAIWIGFLNADTGDVAVGKSLRKEIHEASNASWA